MSASTKRVFLAIGIAVLACQPGCTRGSRPDVPAVAGRAWSVVGDTWQFTVSALDQDGDDVSFRFRRDSEVDTGWTGYVPSGVELGSARAWAAPGRHHIAAQARDDRGGLSEWSDDHIVTAVPSPGYPDRVTGYFEIPIDEADLLTVSPDGGRLYVAHRGARGISVHDIATGGLVGSIAAFARGIYDFALSPDGTVLYLACHDRLFVFDAIYLSVLDSVDVDARVVRAAPGGDFVCAMSQYSLCAISTATWAVVGTLELDSDDAGEVMGLSPDGRLGYAVESYGLLVFELPGCELRERVPIPLNDVSELVVSPDGRYVYLLDREDVPGVHVVSTADMSFIYGPILQGDEAPDDMVMMPSGDFLLTAHASGDSVAVLRALDLSFVQSYHVPVSGAAVAVSPDGSRAFVTSANNRVQVLGYGSSGGAD